MIIRTDYPDSYRVYQLPALSEEELQGSWEHLPELAVSFLGVIPVAEVRFDSTKREWVNTAIFRELLAQQEMMKPCCRKIAQRYNRRGL